MIPRWLQTHLETIGAANPDGIGRTARITRCRSCHQPVIAGLDADRAAGPATVDPTPLSTLGEALALATGRTTYTLRTQPRLQLDHRYAIAIRHNPADHLTNNRDVVADHTCGADPLPTRPSRLDQTERARVPADAPPPF